MKNLMFLIFLFVNFTMYGVSTFPMDKLPENQKNNFTGKNPKIQVALLLDTSNSMDGLIEQAKSQLWKMVNELATAEKGGKTPDIEIALYEYGNDKLSLKEGYVRQVVGLTNDLDLVSEKLFSLTTLGGNEYCGWVIKDAFGQLQWSEDDDELKLIIIAGNEAFNQGEVDYKVSCKNAISKGIMINTIFCGNFDEGVNTFWKDGADLTDGKYMNIDQNSEVVHITTPYDDKIIELNKKLNKTYIGYGRMGVEKSMNQSAQDKNAAMYGAANARTRALFKSKKAYKNYEWDMVDAAEEDVEFVDKLEEEELPDELKGKSKEEIEKYIEEKAKERKAIQKELGEIEGKVNKFIAEKRKENAENLTLDKVMIDAIREQAVTKGYKF